MKRYMIFDLSTGQFVGSLFVPEQDVERNVPQGCGYVEGVFDPRTQRVDLASGKVTNELGLG
jgi:hypothetical protein